MDCFPFAEEHVVILAGRFGRRHSLVTAASQPSADMMVKFSNAGRVLKLRTAIEVCSCTYMKLLSFLWIDSSSEPTESLRRAQTNTSNKPSRADDIIAPTSHCSINPSVLPSYQSSFTSTHAQPYLPPPPTKNGGSACHRIHSHLCYRPPTRSLLFLGAR